MLLTEWLHRHGGIAHTSEIYAAGFSKRAVAVAVGDGTLTRVRRSWIATSGCDAELITAVAAGGRLTCASQARRLGLWVPDDHDVHVVVPPGAGRSSAPGAKIHWSVGPAPVHPRASFDPLINVLHHIARCLQPRSGLAVWDSALNKKLIAPDVLKRVHWRGSKERHLAKTASALSDSGLETEFVLLMKAIGVSLRQQVWIDGRPVDALIGEKLIVQLDGFEHHSTAAARRRDIEADARLQLRGFTVLRFDYYQVFFQPWLVQELVVAAMAQGLHQEARSGRRV
ncbi:type IV toxin-antitoxin system AbiEi family antitoxin domain-containing protein [Microbacterium sp. NPDC089318]